MILQQLLHKYHMREVNNFERSKFNLEGLQRESFAKLTKIYRKYGYADFSPDYEALPENLGTPDLETIWKKQKHVTWEATSGTTGGRKWIPYTQEFRADVNRAASLWLGDLAIQEPGILHGAHYWSLSWLPQELRNQYNNDDTHLLPAWQRWIYRKVLAVPGTLQNLPTSEDSWFATQVYLAHREDLSLISVWSPTFALRLANDIFANIAKLRAEGPAFLARHGLPPVAKRKMWPQAGMPQRRYMRGLWPHLRVISCWDSATSTGWAKDLQNVFPTVKIQGKGLWATEGPVTIPYNGSRMLCAHSHFYEFRCLRTQKIIPAWKLEKDQIVQPLLWQANGFYRYPLQDRMLCSGFEGRTPKLEFLGRLASTDLVGEKIEESFVADLLRALTIKNPELRLGGMIAARDQRRYYLTVVGKTELPGLETAVEEGLMRNHHYRLARELNQLEPAQIKLFGHFDDLQNKISTGQLITGQAITGQSKIETLRLLDTF